MDTILTVFKSLDINHTFFYQFGIICFLYLVLRSLLFGKLQEVLDLREERTTKMEDGAQDKFVQAQKLADEYKEKLDEARGEAFKVVSAKKSEVEARERKRLKEHEAKLDEEVSSKRKDFEAEVESKRSAVMQNADGLSEELVNKILG